MKKKIAVIIILIIMLIPIKFGVKDGGTVVYKAVLYSVTKRHEMSGPPIQPTGGYYIGTEIKILFFEVYNDVGFVPDE